MAVTTEHVRASQVTSCKPRAASLCGEVPPPAVTSRHSATPPIHKKSLLNPPQTTSSRNSGLCRELLSWLYPIIVYSSVAYASVCMSNYLSYMVMRDLSTDPHFRTPLTDYILPTYHEGFVMDETLMSISDTLSFLMFLVPGLLIFYEKDRRAFVWMLGADTFLVAGKAIARHVTVLPESVNPDYCKQATESMQGPLMDTSTSLGYFLWIIHPTYEACSDMMWSGHTQHLIGGGIVLCYLTHRLRMRYLCLRSRLYRTVLQVLVWLVAITGIVTMMLTRAHYSVDVFVAGLMTPLVYTNPFLRVFFEKAFRVLDEPDLSKPLSERGYRCRMFDAWRSPTAYREVNGPAGLTVKLSEDRTAMQHAAEVV